MTELFNEKHEALFTQKSFIVIEWADKVENVIYNTTEIEIKR